ncbi:MAG: pectate lyase, partial [Verrucomicrobiota bacterium]
NVLRHGPDTPPDLALFRFVGEGDLELHAADNLAFDRAGRPAPLVREDNRYGGRIRPRPDPGHWPPGLVARPAAAIEAEVLATAGATPWDRDPVDARIVRGIRDGTGRVSDSEREVGGYPPVAPPVRRPFDPAAWDLRTMEPLPPGTARR